MYAQYTLLLLEGTKLNLIECAEREGAKFVSMGRRGVARADNVGGGDTNRKGNQQWTDPVGAGVVAIFLLVSAFTAQTVNGDSEQENSITSEYIRRGPGPDLGKQLIREFRKNKGSDEPTQVHISLNGPNYMHISWVTKAFGTPSTVKYGTTSGIYNDTASGKATSYTYILYKSGEIHDVVIGPLHDATTYYYRLGRGSDEYSFKTPPAPGPEVPLSFAVVGDLGQTSWTTTTLKHIQSSNYDVMIYAGDLSYADYYQPLWDSFGELVSPLARMRPWMVTEGNHEKEYLPLVVEAFRSYNARWSMPFSESGSSSNLFYSFEVAGCHILMLGSYTGYSATSAQYKWLQADLAKVDRTKTPWLIAMLHAPWYNSNTAHQGDGDGMMASIEPLLFAAKVDMLFAGHVHAYERTTRVYRGVPNPLGIVHITVGDGGNREGLASDFISPQPMWSLFREASFGYGQLKIQNSTTAHWSWHRNDDNVDITADQVLIKSLSSSHNLA